MSAAKATCTSCGAPLVIDAVGPFAHAEIIGPLCPACTDRQVLDGGGCILTLRHELAGASFSLGKITITPGAVGALSQSGQHAVTFLPRHAVGDWGNFGECDRIELSEDDVVNLGYVINVIEDLAERAATLRQAWGLAGKLLVVAAQVAMDGRGKTPVEFGDGILTGRSTFQKICEQGELKGYLEEQLGTEAMPAAPGVFYLFKDEAGLQQFLDNRFRRLPVPPRKPIAQRQFEEHRSLLEPLMLAIASLGRLPGPDEFPQAAEVTSQFGTLKGPSP